VGRCRQESQFTKLPLMEIPKLSKSNLAAVAKENAKNDFLRLLCMVWLITVTRKLLDY
jgi:hypothetical protein